MTADPIFEQPSSPPGRATLQFGLKHLLYAIALFAASLGLCGVSGLFVAPVILLFWWGLFAEVRKQAQQNRTNPMRSFGPQETDPNDRPAKHRGFTLVELLVVIAIIGILIALLLPAVSRSPPYFRHWYNLNQIAMALRSYQDQHGCLPPAYLADASGRPMHSWRVLILPQLKHEALYRQFRWDEPWDGPNNAKLLEQMPREFEMVGAREDQRSMTAYQVVVGPETAWPGVTGRSWKEIRDSGTLLVVECENRPVPWTAPHDPTEDEAIACLMDPPRFPKGHWARGFFTSTCYGRFAVLAERDKPDVWRGLPSSTAQLKEGLRVADGRPGPDKWRSWYHTSEHPVRVLHYANWASLAVFLVVALWPTVWLRVEIRRVNASKAKQARSVRKPGWHTSPFCRKCGNAP